MALVSTALGSCTLTSAAIEEVTVNGRKVDVVEQAFVIPIQYSRFTIAGRADVEITHSEPIQTFAISPRRRNLPATSKGNRLRFRLDGWGYWILRINDDLHMLFADPPTKDPPLPPARRSMPSTSPFHFRP